MLHVGLTTAENLEKPDPILGLFKAIKLVSAQAGPPDSRDVMLRAATLGNAHWANQDLKN
jgi:hypothetical protein